MGKAVQSIQPTVGTGAATVTNGGNSERVVPKIWAKDIESYRQDNLVFFNLVNHGYETEIAYGDVLHIPFMAELEDDVTNNYTIGQEVAVESADISLVDIKIDQYKRRGVALQDALKAQSKPELKTELKKRLGRWLARVQDKAVYETLRTGLTNTAIEPGAKLTYESIVDAMTALDEKNVPEDDRYLVIDSVGRGDLRKVPEFTAYKETGEKGLVKSKNGMIGEIYGVPVYVTNVIKPQTSDSDKRHYVLFHRTAAAVATQNVPSMEFDRNANKGQDEWYASTLFGTAMIRADHGVVIKRGQY